ncbi:cytochrome P450 monooxygenase-like protein [Myriangium duriaei CBS 260.36]|uniref:Cytochrome P450 monooxygenase-like protein n=1 Tax=Myriangium duriaei CBS 260.36 TaxID=1168546 RepID=A0A9P4J4W9_9PEZI|nr:cytochrome P450 monooxygenase-like protein [Myriangium duriaei CBS 260.36]
MSLFLWGLFGLLVVYWGNCIRCLLRNIELAKQSGLPYCITPVYFLNRKWLIQAWIWLPLLYKLPHKWIWPWAYLLDNDWAYKYKREPFDYFKSNVFLIVAPGRISCFVADADAITQIATRRNDFPKPINLYTSVDIFGKNVVSTEGQIWRHHRKITSPPFTEKNNYLVWTESLHQAQAMVESWIAPGETISKPVGDLSAAAMRLSLHVISRAGFGVRLFWPHEEMKQKGRVGEVPAGHTMTYKDALSTLLENIIQAFLLPKWFLKHSPFKINQIAYQALTEWKQYMQELYDEKKVQVASGELTEGMDLMGALVRGAGVAQSSSTSNFDAEKGKPTGQLLTDEEILGNAFVFILAGHETAANTINFSLLQLAINPSSQIRLQKDIDAIFGTRPVSDWNYDIDVPKLFGSMAGAVMNEELRLFPPVVGIPKSVAPSAPQPLTVDGKRVTIPAGTLVTLDVLGTHLDRNNWPALVPPTSSAAEIDADLRRFRPERWLLDHSTPRTDPAAAQQQHQHQQAESEDIGGPSSADTSASLFRPRRGAYLPFSEGFRACLGRRFAQVEVLAVLAVIFRTYSVELAVEEILAGEGWPFAGKEEIREQEMLKGGEERGRKEAWEEAKVKIGPLFEEKMMTIITLQMRGARVPVRFVKRGSERFWYDD